MSDPTVAAALENPTIPAARRMELIAAPRYLDPEATNLARMLIESRHVDQAAGRIRATVTAAVELSSDERERLSRQLSKRLGKEVHVTATVDRRIIGGLNLQFGRHP